MSCNAAVTNESAAAQATQLQADKSSWCVLQYDVVAGVSIAFMVIPQGISYATAGGLPSVYGARHLTVVVKAYELVALEYWFALFAEAPRSPWHMS